MSYFLIYQHDKEATVRQVTEENLKEMLKEMVENEEEPVFLTNTKATPLERDPGYWGDNAYLLIKGEIIVPKPKEVVTEYTIE